MDTSTGKRDSKTIKENGINVKYQKDHLLYNIREVYQLFMKQNPREKISYHKHLLTILKQGRTNFSLLIKNGD